MSKSKGLPGDPTTKNNVSIEHLLNSSPPRQSWSVVSIRKKGGPFDFFDEESLSATTKVVAQKRNNAVTNFIAISLPTLSSNSIDKQYNQGVWIRRER